MLKVDSIVVRPSVCLSVTFRCTEFTATGVLMQIKGRGPRSRNVTKYWLLIGSLDVTIHYYATVDQVYARY